MSIKTKSQERRRILELGESLRENPGTILLSVPIFFFGYLFYSIIGDKEGVAGSLGHCGITFKNYYKHYWKQDFLLKIAYRLYDKSAQYATGEGKVSTIHHAGQVALELGDVELAEKRYKEALSEARRLKLVNIEAYVIDHMAQLEIERGNYELAKEYLDGAYNILSKAVKKEPKSMYLHIWLSSVEINTANYWLAVGDKNKARIWAKHAQKRADKYDLKMRKKDVKKIMDKLVSAGVALVLPVYGVLFS